jgi:hypothetical protein
MGKSAENQLDFSQLPDPVSSVPEPSFTIVLWIAFLGTGWAAFRRGKITA